jgi:succinoglycan biosynthesis transport protein ExoP
MKSTIPPSLRPDTIAIDIDLESDDLSFRQAARTLRKRGRIVLATALTIMTLALIVSMLLRPYYKSTATIEIEQGGNDLGAGLMGAVAANLTGEDDSKNALQTEVAILQSDDLGIETIERINFEGHEAAGQRSNQEGDRSSEERGLPLSQAPRIRAKLLGDFEAHLKVIPIPDTQLIQVTFEDPDPRFSSEAANSLIDQYIQDRLQRRNSSMTQATDWMASELDGLKKQVQGSEQNLFNYQRDSGLIVSPGGTANGGESPTATSPVLERLTQLNETLVNAETKRITQEALYELAKSGNMDALSSSAVEMQASGADESQSAIFTRLVALRQQETTLDLQVAAGSESYGAKNPHLIELQEQLRTLHSEMKTEIERILNSVKSNYEASLEAENGIRAAYEKEEQEAFKMNDSAIKMAVLQQEAKSMRTLYQDLYTKLQESRLSVGTQSTNVEVISRALAPSSPAHPRKGLNTCVGLMAGLVLGILLAFLAESLDDTISTLHEVERLSGAPVLAAIPNFQISAVNREDSGKTVRVSKTRLPAPTGRESSEVLEAYRTLRTAILLSNPGKPPRTLLVSSAVPSEGKTTTCYGLGRCFAALGNRVLLIDADMRRPALHRQTQTSNDRGLSNLLTSNEHFEAFLKSDKELKDLLILPAGPIPPNPAELLASGVFDSLLSELSSQFDLILLDSPPAMLVADASILSVKVDEVIAVVKWGSTKRSAVTRLFETLRRNGAKILGVVLNSVDTQSADYYYERGYYGTDYLSEGKNGN